MGLQTRVAAMPRQEMHENRPPWSAERRLEFIDFRLHWERTVNRSDLIEFFRISPQQASADLARYAELAPGNLEYDKSLKTYRARAGFKPATDAVPPLGWRMPVSILIVVDLPAPFGPT